MKTKSSCLSSNVPVNSIAFSKSAFSELGPFSGSSFPGVLSEGTIPGIKKIM